MRRSCRILLALVLMVGLLLPTMPVMAVADEGPVLEKLEVIPGNLGVTLRFDAMINSMNVENIIVEGIYDGVADRIYPEIYYAGDSLVKIYLHENVQYYSDYRVTIERDAVFEEFFGNQNVYVEEWTLADALSSSSLEFGSGSDELGVATTMTIEFVTDKLLSGGLDQIILAENGHWQPGQHFYLDSVTDVFITIDGVEYPTGLNREEDTMRIWLPQGLNVAAGGTVGLTFQNVMTPGEWQQDSSDIFIRTTQHESWVGKSIWFYNNDDKNPAHVSMKPVDANGAETVAYNYEQTSYELEFETVEDMNGMTIRMLMPYGFEVLGYDGMGMGGSVERYDTEGLVDITVTGSVYHPANIRAYTDGGFIMEMDVNQSIPAGETVRVTFHDDVIRTPVLPGEYMIKMWSYDGSGYSILLPTTVEQGQYQPQPPPQIRDLELQVSNTNSYLWYSEHLPVEFLGNGDRVVYTLTGTAVTQSDHANIFFLSDSVYWTNFWGEEANIYEVRVKVDGEWISADASYNGEYVIVNFRKPNDPNLLYHIQEGQTFEIQLTLRNPRFDEDFDRAVFPIIVDMNGSFGMTEVEIQKINPVIALFEPYAGVQAGQYMFDVNDSEGFNTASLDFPAGTVMPEDISMEDMEISFFGWGNPPELLGIEVVGSSIELEFSSFVNQLSVTVLDSAGIPTPSVSGTYKYGVTYNGQSHDVIAQLATVPEDPKLLTAELIGHGNYASVGNSYAVDLVFDGALDASYISQYSFAHHYTNNLPITITYPMDGEMYTMDVCWAEVYPEQANTMRVYVNCDMSENDVLDTTTEAIVKLDNAMIRGVGGTYSPGVQSVKLITAGTSEALAEKLAAFAEEGETLNIGHLLQAMRDPEVLSLLGDSLNPHTAKMFLQHIETKFVE